MNMKEQLTSEEIIKKVLAGKMTVVTAMTEYSNLQTAALQSRVMELEAYSDQQAKVIEYDIKWMNDQKSKIAELERENARLKEIIDIGDKQASDVLYSLRDSKQHAEKLMGLLEKEVRYRWRIKYSSHLINNMEPPGTEDEFWQSYCKEHGL